MTTHSAAGSAAGYLYQCERALLELVERSRENLTLFLESLDDVHLEKEGLAVEILQLKHHIGGGADLSDTSPDFWRAMAVWLDLADDLGADETPLFTLLTTSDAPSDSAASLLAALPRDPDNAKVRLEAAARGSTNAATRTTRERFLALDPRSRSRLVSWIRIRLVEPQLTDLDDRLASLLSLHVMLPAGRAEAFLERLKGWWYGRCVAMLTSSGGVTTLDLGIFIAELRDSFHPDDLPPSFDLPDPTETEVATYGTSVFVQQLLWISYSNEQLLDAIRDYHRAFTQRSKWARQGLIYPGELDQYERRLVDQWRRVFHDMVTEISSDADDAEKERVGRYLLQSLRDSSAVRLRARHHDVMLTHGTLHHLANEREVGWHPDFQRRLENLLAGAA
jgi:hypothetical protein